MKVDNKVFKNKYVLDDLSQNIWISKENSIFFKLCHIKVPLYTFNLYL